MLYENEQLPLIKLDDETSWEPVFEMVPSENRIFLRLVDWKNGSPDEPKPPIKASTYIGRFGFVTNFSEAIDTRDVLERNGYIHATN